MEGKEGWDSDKRLKKRSGAGNEGHGDGRFRDIRNDVLHMGYKLSKIDI